MPYRHGLYTGLKYYAKQIGNPLIPTAANIQAIDDFLNAMTRNRQEDGVVSVFMIPTAFLQSNFPEDLSGSAVPVSKSYSVSRPTSIEGHTVRNKKLLTYPYCFLNVDTLNESKIYRYEFSREPSKTLNFNLTMAVTPNAEIMCMPVNYNGAKISVSPQNSGYNPTEAVICSAFPQCAYIIDAYRAWLAQKATGQAIGAIGSFATMVGSLATGNVLGGVIGATGLASSINNMVVGSTQGSRARNANGGSIEVANRSKGIYFKKMNVTEQYANIIDDFFDRYGYATERIKVPNRNVRASWTYCKTRDCALHGNVPAEALEKIKSIYDKGITWWNKNVDIGNYSLSNGVLT